MRREEHGDAYRAVVHPRNASSAPLDSRACSSSNLGIRARSATTSSSVGPSARRILKERSGHRGLHPSHRSSHRLRLRFLPRRLAPPGHPGHAGQQSGPRRPSSRCRVRDPGLARRSVRHRQTRRFRRRAHPRGAGRRSSGRRARRRVRAHPRALPRASALVPSRRARPLRPDHRGGDPRFGRRRGGDDQAERPRVLRSGGARAGKGARVRGAAAPRHVGHHRRADRGRGAERVRPRDAHRAALRPRRAPVLRRLFRFVAPRTWTAWTRDAREDAEGSDREGRALRGRPRGCGRRWKARDPRPHTRRADRDERLRSRSSRGSPCST